jgi:two-component system, OmpR family, alkaline phosphatase synthesis response regulator PhoP
MDRVMRVLVAEDNVAMGNVIAFNLKKAGLDVVHVASGAAAWQRLQQPGFDLLLTDFQMPGMNGGDLCKRVREEPSLAGLPVILLTAKGLEIDTDYYRDTLRVNALILKPFSPRELLRVVLENLAAGASSGQTGQE